MSVRFVQICSDREIIPTNLKVKKKPMSAVTPAQRYSRVSIDFKAASTSDHLVEHASILHQFPFSNKIHTIGFNRTMTKICMFFTRKSK